MTDHLTEDDIIAAVPGLTRARLSAFVAASVVMPLRQSTADSTFLVFRAVDLARLHLVCDLLDDMELDETVLDVIISLIDQLHAARSDLRAIARAVLSEPQDVRARIGRAIIRSDP